MKSLAGSFFCHLVQGFVGKDLVGPFCRKGSQQIIEDMLVSSIPLGKRDLLFRQIVATIVVATGPVACLGDGPTAGSDELFRRLDADASGAIATTEVPADHRVLFGRLLRKADVDGNKSLSREEFLAALVPSRPEKQIEEKQSDSYPQANAVRYLLLSMDTRKDSSIEPDEVPADMRPVYEDMVQRIDTNKNGSMDRYELARGARDLGQLAARYVRSEGINVAKALKKFDKSQGELAQRFDKAPGPMFGNLGSPEQARRIFKQFDANSDNQVELEELPPPAQPQFERLMRFADRNRDGGLSEREFLTAAERIGRVMSRQQPNPKAVPKPSRNARGRAKLAPADAAANGEMSTESMPSEDP